MRRGCYRAAVRRFDDLPTQGTGDSLLGEYCSIAIRVEYRSVAFRLNCTSGDVTTTTTGRRRWRRLDDLPARPHVGRGQRTTDDCGCAHFISTYIVDSD